MFSFIRDTFSFIIFNLFDITLVTAGLAGPAGPGDHPAPAAHGGGVPFCPQAVLRMKAHFKDFVYGLRKYFWKAWLIVLPYVLFLARDRLRYPLFLSAEQPSLRLWAAVPMAVLSIVLIAAELCFCFLCAREWRGPAGGQEAFCWRQRGPFFTMGVLLITLLLFLGLYATRIGLALVFVGPVAVLQTKAVQYLLPNGRSSSEDSSRVVLLKSLRLVRNRYLRRAR